MSSAIRPVSGVAEGRAFSEIELVIVTGSVWVAGYFAWDLPTVLGLSFVLVSIALRRRFFLAVGLVALAGGLAADANGAYEAAAVPGSIDERVTVISDVETFGAGSRSDAKLSDGRRVELLGFGPEGNQLRKVEPGGSAVVVGYLQPATDKPWLKVRHVVGRVLVSSVAAVEEPPFWRRPPEVLRSLVSRGADALPAESRPLYTGLVIGDDSDQSAAQRAHFQASGLTHLLAVSGQNVAFVLAVLAPLLVRLRSGERWLLALAALAIFAVATRLEPSVMRAAISAGLATSLSLVGLKTSGLRILCLATIGLLLLDPFLARSVGFQLSVAASLGILVASPAIAARAKLPSFIWTPLSVTVGAQLFVSPLLVIVFGQLPLASIPANLLAGWAAGFVMILGLTVGLLAGFLPEMIAAFAQLPNRSLLWWIDSLSRATAKMPLPVLGAYSLWSVAAVSALWFGLRSQRTLRVALGLVLVVQLVMVTPQPPKERVEIGSMIFIPGSSTLPSVLLLGSGASSEPVFWLVDRRVRRIDVVVVENGGRRSNELVTSVRQVSKVGLVLAPSQHRVVGAQRVLQPTTIQTTSGPIQLRSEGSRLEVVP